MLLGDPKVGKSTLVKTLLQKGRITEVDKSGRSTNIVEIQFPNGDVKKIIFHELQTLDLTDSTKEINLDQKFDVICICFEHVNYLKKFMQEKKEFLKYPVPKMALLCKGDELKLDRKAAECKELEEMGLKIFAECSSKTGEFSNFLNSLQKIVENP